MEEMSRSLLAFYNVLARELGITDFKRLEEMRNFLPTMIHLIDTGDLDFRPEKDFGYDFAVKHIKKRGADNHLIMDLSPEGADSGDLKEILKVLMMLIYELRQLHSTIFISFCDKLDHEMNSEIAQLISVMDDCGVDRRCQPLSPGSCIPTRTPRPRTKVSKHSFQPYKYHMWRQRSAIAFRGSPVAQAVNSPQGEQLAKSRQQAKDLVLYKKLYNECLEENDSLHASCEDKDQELKRLKIRIALLKDPSKNPTIQHFKNKVEEQELALIELKSQVNQLSIEADILRQKYLNARVQWQAQEIMVNLEQTREEADDHFKENKSMKKQLNEADQQVNKVKTERRPSTSSNEPTASSCRLDFNYPSPNRIGSLERISFPIAKSTPTNQDEMTVSGRLDNTDDLITEDEPMILASRNITFEYIDYLY